VTVNEVIVDNSNSNFKFKFLFISARFFKD